MADPTFMGIIDFVYWALTGTFGMITEGAEKVMVATGVPSWFLIVMLLVFMIILFKQKLSTWVFWILILLGIIMLFGLSGTIPMENFIGLIPSSGGIT